MLWNVATKYRDLLVKGVQYYRVYNCATQVFRGLIMSQILQYSMILHVEGSLAATRHQSVVHEEQFPCPH
jgi:hypothetical protein